MKRSETWIRGLVQQREYIRLGRIPAVISSGNKKRSVRPDKPKQEKGTFIVGESVIGEGDVI